MARSKSIPGNKTSRAKTDTDNDKEQVGTGAASVAEVKSSGEAVQETEAELKTANTGIAPQSKAIAEPASVARAASESKGNWEGRKFEVMKTDSRKNLVPINLDDEIRRRAYEIYEQRGAGSGSEAEDWFTAEREVQQRYRQQSA